MNTPRHVKVARDKRILKLKAEGLSAAEIAEVVGVTHRHVRVVIRQARAKLDADVIAEVLGVLEDVEFSAMEDDPDGGHYAACPICGGGDPDNPATPQGYEGHTDDCRLAAVLAKARGQPSAAPT